MSMINYMSKVRKQSKHYLKQDEAKHIKNVKSPNITEDNSENDENIYIAAFSTKLVPPRSYKKVIH